MDLTAPNRYIITETAGNRIRPLRDPLERGVVVNEYEVMVLRGWLADDASPTLAERVALAASGRIRRTLAAVALARRGKPIALLDRLTAIAREAILRALEQADTPAQQRRVYDTIRQLGGGAQSAEEVRLLPLRLKDETSRKLAVRHGRAVATEGLAAGFTVSLCELIPGLQAFAIPAIAADLAATVYMMAQSAVQTGYSYGYTLDNPEDLPHLLTAMAPYAQDASLIEAKLAAHAALRQTGAAVVRSVADHAAIRALASANPAVHELIDAIATRLAMRLAEKELGLALPIIGALTQGAVNVAFAHYAHRKATRYFQRLHLVERYGEPYVNERLQDERQRASGAPGNARSGRPMRERAAFD